MDEIIPNPMDIIATGNSGSITLSALLANPALLQKLDEATTVLGITFQSLVSQIDEILQFGGNKCLNAYQDISNQLIQHFPAASDLMVEINKDIGEQLNVLCGSMTSGAQPILDKCSQKDMIAAAKLHFGEYALIENCFPDAVNWPISYPPWIDCFPPIWQHYAVDASGAIADGQKLLPDFSWELADGTIIKFPNPDKLKQLINQPGGPPLGKGYDATKVVLDVNCEPDCIPEVPITPIEVPTNPGGSVITNPVVNPEKPVITNPVIPPIVVNPVIPTPIVLPGSPASACPPSNFTIQVNPTPVQVNVAPCQPIPSGPIIGNSSPLPLGSNGKPLGVSLPNNCNEGVLRMFTLLGYPQEFIDGFSDLCSQVPDGFNTVEPSNNTEGFVEEYI